MNKVRILVQTKEEPKNLLDTKAKADAFPEGLTVVLIEGATEGGQLGTELIIKGKDIYGKETISGFAITENNWESLMGAFIGARMRFGRMPADQWQLVREYLKQQITRYAEQLPEDKKEAGEDLKKYFRV